MAEVGLAAEVLDEPGGVGAGGELSGEDDQLLALPQGSLQEGEGLLQVAPHLSGGIGPETHVGLEVGLQKVKGGGTAGGSGFLQAAGFREIRQYGNRKMRAPKAGEDRIFFVARKDPRMTTQI